MRVVEPNEWLGIESRVEEPEPDEKTGAGARVEEPDENAGVGTRVEEPDEKLGEKLPTDLR